MTFVLLIFLAFLAASFSAASVTVQQPLNNQLPLVARIGQPYSWSLSPLTFSSTNDGPLRYTTSTLPAWLSFDDSTQTFHGTPTQNGEGYPEITVTAHTGDSSTSSRFTICVTHATPPTLNIPIANQFNESSKSLSSVFSLRPNSAIATPNPALRIPRKWSFSVGLEYDTFLGAGGRHVYYELRMANGSEIPEYINFNSKTVTLDGVIPPSDEISQPVLLPFMLHASDQEGYTAATLPFDFIVADHEFSQLAGSLPTINITTSTPFVVSLQSPNDLAGILVDGGPIQPSNISSLQIDVSNYGDWLKYDAPSRTLSGTPGDDVTGTNPILPVTMTTIFNQTLRTNVSLALVESYFVLPVLPSIQASRGEQIHTSLTQWFSKSSSKPGVDGSNITAEFIPSTSANWLRFDEYSTNLTGTIPADYQSDSDHVTVEFTAYSHITHSTSHTSQAIYIANTGNTKSLAPTHPSGLATQAHKRLVLAVVLTFSLIGGICALAGVVALMRRWTKVEDTAVLGEEGRNAWSEKDRRWYGMTLSPGGTTVIENPTSAHSSPSRTQAPQPDYGSPGLGLRRVSERSQQEEQSELVSPGVMSKKEFLSRIKETVRQVSDKYARKQRAVHTIRPAIGKPILVNSTRNEAQGDQIFASPTNPFEESVVSSRPVSTFMTGSPSSSTGEHSIPRRRPDFAPPKHLAQVPFKDGLLVRQGSTGSMGENSFLSRESGVSDEMEESMGPPTKPRLVPFTSSTRVPVPEAIPGPQGGGLAGKRIASQRARVCEANSKGDINEISGLAPSGTSDELSMGIHYVRSLGADQLAVNGGGGVGSSPALSNIRSSFASLESSHVGRKSGTASLDVMKVLVRTGERFKFRVPVPSAIGKDSSRSAKGYHVRLTSGQPLPKFIHADIGDIGVKGTMELSGVSTFRDLGDSNIGVYADEDGSCVASIVVEVVGKR